MELEYEIIFENIMINYDIGIKHNNIYLRHNLKLEIMRYEESQMQFEIDLNVLEYHFHVYLK